MLSFNKILLCFLVLEMFTFNSVTANNNLQSYVGLSYNNQLKKGYLSAFAFHDHDPRFGNSNFHIHNYCNPFVAGKEILQFLNLNAQYRINKKIAVNISLPYSLKSQVFGDSLNLFRNGIGDISIGFKYALFSSNAAVLFSKTKHQTIISINAKLNTGKYNTATDLGDIDPHIQNGSGSNNWQVAMQHFIAFDKWSFNGSASYFLNTKNYYQFKKGNAFEALLASGYTFKFNNEILLTPTLQLSYQKNKADTMEDRVILKPTEYEVFLMGGAIELQLKRTIFCINFALPAYLKYKQVDVRCKAPEQHQNFDFELRWMLK